ncbi:MAG: TonB-dependent receptor plug domain-containing protein, partial [bacterium]|nr:TonB-dependent receptor plug domain-containing protein [bacterium]
MKILIIYSVFVLIAVNAFSQKNISGKITDNNNRMLSDVKISTINYQPKYTATTNKDGEYSIDLPEDISTLEFSKEGYRVQIIKISNNTIDIKMTSLEDVDLYDLTIDELMSVKIITASRTKRDIKDLPVTVRVISRDEIINNNYLTLTDALKDIHGIKVSQPGSCVDGEMFTIRGFVGNKYVKILLNGQPLQTSVMGFLSIGEQINMKAVERIEIVYGPTSTLYGADALAGVVNIITYSPDQTTGIFESTVTKDYICGSFFTNVKLDNNLRLGLHGVIANRYDLNINKESEIFDKQNLFGDKVIVNELPMENKSFGINFEVKDFRFSYDYLYRNSQSSIGQTADYYIYDNPDLIWGETLQNYSIQNIFELKKISFSTSLSYLRYRMDEKTAFGLIFYPTPLYKYLASDDILVEEIINFNISDNFDVVGGVSFQYSGALPKTNDLTIPFSPSFYKPFSTNLPEQGKFQAALLEDFGFNPLKYYNIGSFLELS